MTRHTISPTPDMLQLARQILAGSGPAPITAASACCSSAQQDVCCEPSDKAECCGTSGTSAGGCGCQ